MQAAIRYATDMDAAPCRAIVALQDDVASGRKCTPKGATEYANRIIGCYRASNWVDPKMFTMALVAVLADRHPAVVAMAADPVHGVARKFKFAPSISEVADELDAIERRLGLAAIAAHRLLNGERPPVAEMAVTTEITDPKIKRFMAQFAESKRPPK